MRWDRAYAALLDVLAPRHCAFCAVACDATERSICAGCFDDLPFNEPMVSPQAGRLHTSIAVLEYEFPIDVAIKAFKFHRKSYYGSAFAEILMSASSAVPCDVDAVLPVPLHWFRRSRRGYNQAGELARPLARKLGVPVIRSVRRVRATPFQSGLDASERARNLHNAFVVRGSLEWHHVLIVDDVVTTGTTLETIARVLRRAGVGHVSAMCLARAR